MAPLHLSRNNLKVLLVGALCSAPLDWDLSTPSGLRGACFWIRDKRRMPPNEAKPEIIERYSQGEQEAFAPIACVLLQRLLALRS